MAKSVEVIIKGKTFKLGYGLEVFINLGELWGFDTLEEVNEQFQVLSAVGGGSTPLKNLKVISEIIAAMVQAEPENKEAVTAAEIRNISMGEFQDLAMQLTLGFVANMPQPGQEDNEKKLKPKAKEKKV